MSSFLRGPGAPCLVRTWNISSIVCERKIKLKFLADTDVSLTNWVMIEVWVVTKCFRPNLYIYWYVHPKICPVILKIFLLFFFSWKMWHLNSFTPGFLLLWKLGKNLAGRCPGAAQMSSEVRILSNNCQHFIKIWLFLPNPRAKWNSLSPACLNGHMRLGAARQRTITIMRLAVI